MNRRLHLVLALLLPLMALRALLPAGYMPVSEGGELRIAMCSAGLSAPDSPDGAPADDGQLPAATDSCPFAIAGSMAPPPQSGWHVWQIQSEVAPAVPSASSVPLPTIDRAQSQRGPPALSV